MAEKIDKRSGSIAYNRLDMQISQVFHLAIELYDSLDYLIVLDHEDDITLYEDESRSDAASYYQMKTKDDSITINTALTEGWLGKLYEHLNKPDIFVQELGLITNCPWKLVKQTVSAERTPFSAFNEESIAKIKNDIATRAHIPIEQVDLSKMCHMRTTLSIDRHKDIIQTEAMDFLCGRFLQIKGETIKTIVASVFEVLSRKQGYERLPDDATFNDIKSKKGFAKSTFERIIRVAIKISIPEFDEIQRIGQIPARENDRAALAYTQILADSHRNIDTFSSTFDILESLVKATPIVDGEGLWAYAKRCHHIFSSRMPSSTFLYVDSLYIEVLAICIILAQRGEL